MPRFALIATLLAATLLAGCEMLGMESPEKLAAAREAEGRAVGAACRHAARAIEDCYILNKRVDKAAIFAGWRDMNDYMRENKIDAVAPQLLVQMAMARAVEAKAAEARAAEAKPAVAKASEADDGAADKRGAAKAKPRDAKARTS